MEMWLKRSILLFLTGAVSAVILDEKQRTVVVPFGSSPTLSCKLDTKGFRQFRVAWYFNQSGSSLNNTKPFSEQMFPKQTQTTMVNTRAQEWRDTEETVMNHTLSNVTEKDSGWYFCKITTEIPVLTSNVSNGTKLIIMKSTEHTTHLPLPIITGSAPLKDMNLWMWIALGVSVFILTVLLIICTLLRRRRRISREDPIYANTRSVTGKQPSPRPGVPSEKLNAASSSQNLRNPSPGKRYEEGKRRPKP